MSKQDLEAEPELKMLESYGIIYPMTLRIITSDFTSFKLKLKTVLSVKQTYK